MKFNEITEEEFQIFKPTACELARLDGKEPLAVTNAGIEEWRAYVPEVKRSFIRLSGFANMPNVRVSAA